MPSKIFDLTFAIKKSQDFKKSGQKIILAGGCFDILHIGHIKFLENAKKTGGKVIILLESDKKVKQLKGQDRPIFKQQDRADALASLSDVDLIIQLPFFANDEDYGNLVEKIKPDVIAVTENDPRMEKKKEQAEKYGGRLKVIRFVESLSSSHLAEILKKEKHY